MSEYVTLRLDQLRVWSGNPRKTLDQASLNELAASIKERGVDQPITVRAADLGYHEVIAGQRRFFASQIAGLQSIPCRVRELTDEQALELAITENAARSDISPMEEAESIEAYLKYGRSIEQAADRFGHTVAWVNARLRLVALTPLWRERVASGRCPIRHAEMLSRLSPEIQTKVAERYPNGIELPASAQFEQSIAYYLRFLDSAPFDVSDATYPRGSCEACPSRSDKQTELFTVTARNGGACLDFHCWSEKVEHRWERAQKDAKKRKLRVLTADDVRFYGNGTTTYESRWIELERAKKYNLPPAAIARDDYGTVVELVTREAFDRALSEAQAALKKERDARAASGSASDDDVRSAKADATAARIREERLARTRALLTALRGPNARKFVEAAALDVIHGFPEQYLRPAIEASDDELLPAILERADDAELVRLVIAGSLLNVFEDSDLDELLERHGSQTPEQAALVAQMVERFGAAIDAAANADQLGEAWWEVQNEDHRASLPELARRWNERAAALGIKPAAIKKLRKAQRAPLEAA